ncbi:MAG TPA: glycosyltransferase family 39 protein [Saprospiraceae bacterium]|nr:glycosyltransferase family 39 protein [Saprospiraceae bacterium]
MSLSQKTILLIIIATGLRIIFAGSIELGNDEVYYITYAQKLQWNYFDHPPLVGLLIKITSLNLWLTNEIFIRLGPILLAAVDTWLIFRIGTHIKNEKAGYLAALFFTASPYTSIISGLFIMPDAPMLFFWLLSIWLLVRVFDPNISKRQSNISLLLFGLTAGLAIMGKVHAIFLWVGLGIYLLLYNRRMLLNPVLYLAGVISMAIISPIYFWNAQNDFITYKFQGSRVTVNSGFRADSLRTELFGGILYNNPVNYVLILIALIAIFRKKRPSVFPYRNLLLCLSLPLIGILIFVSCFRSTLPHWNGPGFVVLSIVASAWLAETHFTKYNKWLTTANIVLLLIAIVAVLGINFYPGTPGNKDYAKLGEDDLTLEMYGWKQFNQSFRQMYEDDTRSGKMKKNSAIATHKWFPGGHLNFYVALPDSITLIGLGTLNDIHHFYWLNEVRPKLKKGDDAYIIVPSNLNYSVRVDDTYGQMFNAIEKPSIIDQLRNGKPARYFSVYRAHGFRPPEAVGY